MQSNRGFAYLSIADLVVRAAYQMGKSPLLPIFALSLGAGDAFLGFIVSVSTLTGMLFKPLFGLLSDRSGRRLWLLIGTGFFTFTPFAYQIISSPQQLLALRLFHGLATAVYGPVTLAYLTENAPTRVAEKVGWFSLARSGGYIIGPAVAGLLLLYFDPVAIFTLIGIISSLAFVPVLLLPDTERPSPSQQPPFAAQIRHALSASIKSPVLWLAGGIEGASFILLYAVKAFLPVYALTADVSVAVVGGLFAIQETVHIVFKPIGGRLADRFGYLPMIGLGMFLLGSGTIFIAQGQGLTTLGIAALLLGTAQALIFPASIALLAAHQTAAERGSAFGLLGAMNNGGKVAGPVIAGLLMARFGFIVTFNILGATLLISVALIMTWLFFQNPYLESTIPVKAEVYIEIENRHILPPSHE